VLNSGVVSNDGGVACCDDDGVEMEVENEGGPLLILLFEGLVLGCDEVVLVVDVEAGDDRDGSAARR